MARWTAYTISNGLASDTIGYMVEDGQSNLWLGSYLGLMRVSKKSLNDAALGITNFVTCRVFGKSDGLLASECTLGSQPAACRGRDGNSGSPPSRDSFRWIPLHIQAETQSSASRHRVRHGRRVKQNTKRLGASPPTRRAVPAGREQLDIHYASLNLAAADKSRFRYRMDPYETRWVEAGDRRIAPYPKLPPGNYHFLVTACNEDGLWNNSAATLTITVLPPFWRKWWFLSASTLCLLGIIVGIVHYLSTQKLHRQLAGLRQQQALEKERARIARDIHDQVGASLTQLSLLGEMVESDKDSPAEVEAHARQISQTARETSRALDEIVWTVNPSNDTLEGLINYICKHAQEYLAVAGLRYRLDVPAQLPAAVISPEVAPQCLPCRQGSHHQHCQTRPRRRASASGFASGAGQLHPGNRGQRRRHPEGLDGKARRPETDCATCANEWRTSAAILHPAGHPAGWHAHAAMTVPLTETLTAMPITVSIVEDNDQLRGTLARLIDREEGFHCVSHYPDAEAALDALAQRPPEVVLDGHQSARHQRRRMRAPPQADFAPRILAVMLTAYEDTENIFNALAAGAAGYLLKRAPRAELLDAIREVHRGGSPMTTAHRAASRAILPESRLPRRSRPRESFPPANRKCWTS